MLFPEESPNYCHVLNNNIEGDCGKRPANTEGEPQHTEPVQREGLHDAKDVHVDIDGPDERANEIDDGRAGDGTQGREDDVGRGERQRHPGVAGDRQQDLVPQRDGLGVHHEEDALQPAFALLHEVPQSEGRFLPHLALHEVEGVAVLVRPHCEVAVFRH